MIWDSIFLMTVIDMTVIAGFTFVFVYFIKKNPHFSWKKAKRGFFTLFIGLGLIALLFFGDLFTMHILPLLIPKPQAMELMKNLHGEYLWFIVPPGVLFLFTGLVLIISRYGKNVLLLEDSQEQFRMLAENANDLIIIHNDKGQRLYVSPAVKRHLGFDLKDLEGKPAWFLVHPRDREKVYNEWLQRIFVDKKSHKVRVQMKHADGHYVWFENVSEPVIDETGKVKAAVSISRNITEQWEAEEIAELAKRELQDREEFQRTILNTMVDGLMVLNTRGKILSVNKSAAKMFGYSRKELLGLSLPSLMLKSERESYEKHRADYLKTIRRSLIRQGRNEAEGLRKDGKKIAVELAFKSAFESGRRVFVASIVDITDRKEAESKFRLLAEHSNDIIFLREPKGKILYVSPSVKRHLGHNPESLIGKNGWQIVHRDDKKKFKPAWDKAVVKGGKRFQTRLRLKHVNGSQVWFENISEPITDKTGKVVALVTASRNITELREVEEKFRLVAENVNDIITLRDADTKVIFVSPSYEKHLGRSPDEQIGTFFDTVQVHPDEKETLIAWKKKVFGEGKRFIDVFRVKAKSGKYIWFESETEPIKDETGKVTGAVTISRNFTLQKEEESRRIQLGRILDNSLTEIYLTDLGTQKYVFANKAARDNLGYSLAELLKMSPLDLSQVLEGKPELLVESYKPLQTGEKEKLMFESSFLRKDGTRYEVEVNLQLSEWNNRPVVVANIEDVTVKKEIAAQQKEEEDRRIQLGRILDNSLNEIYIADMKTLKYVFANQAARKNLGYSLEELQKMTPLDISQALGGKPKLLIETMKPLKTGEKEKVRFDSTYLRKDGSMYEAEVTLQLSELDNKPVVVANVEDVTIKKETAAKLRQAQKMEAVGQLTGGIAHDFNNLLTAMQGGIRLAEMENISDTARECLKISMGAVKRGADLTHRLLAFSRTQTLNPKVAEINGLVNDFEVLLKRTLGENIEIETSLMKDQGFVKVDVGELENSLLNLSLNARDAMPRGGKLIIEVVRKKISRQEADLKEINPGQFIILSVSDTGSGMPPEVRDNIFEPFFTTKEVGKGTGLGLSSVFGFVKQSGGHITVYSEADIGTTFKLYLPETVKQKVAKPKKKKVGKIDQETTGKILLVEDNEEVRAFVTKALSAKGYKVLEAENGPDALKLMKKISDFDLLLTDIVLPQGMDGVEVAKKFEEMFPDREIIYSSGFTTKAIEKNGFLKEGEEILSKPYNLEELYERVNDGMQNNKP